jgi:glycosyltransferase involved in cell wall biosynthesis
MATRAATSSQPALSRAPVVLVIGPPWLRTGTGRVIEDQIAFYRARGFATAFVAVPVNAAHLPENPMWLELAQAAGELRADHASFAILHPAQRPDALWRRARQVLSPRTALDWIVEVGGCSRPAPALLDYLRGRDVALFHVNHVFTLGFANRLRRQLGATGRAPLLLETHDVQSQVLNDRAEPNPWHGRPDDLELLLRSELALAATADVLIHCSIEDRQFFIRHVPEKPHILARPAIDDVFVAAVAGKGRPDLAPIDILLVGTGYSANVEAVEWFLAEVWPLIAERGLGLKIVGRVGELMGFTRPELHRRFQGCMVGPVADLTPYYRAARSVIAPMRSGGGISIKTIEAFALGKPFVGTSKAYRGLPPEPLVRHGFRGYDDARAFADALLRVLSADDDTGARGRAVYDELFARPDMYAARDEAVRVAQNLRAPLTHPVTAPAQGVNSRVAQTKHVPDMAVLGTSNCVGSNSFVEKTAARTGARIHNLSVGACSSGCGIYQLDKVRPVRRGVAFIDFAINDNDTGSNLWSSECAPEIIAGNIRTMAARLRAMNYLPILLICASDFHVSGEPFGHALYRDVCIKERINFIDLRRMVLGAIGQGTPRDMLMRDDCHLSDGAGDAVADFIASVMRRMGASSSSSVSRSDVVVPSRVLYATDLVPPAALVARGSSLRSALHARVVRGDVVGIPVRAGERLAGVMINIGAKGGTIALRSDGMKVVKSLTAYWNPDRPDWYCAMFIDIAQPLLGGPAGVTLEIVDQDAVPTERTLHAKPVLPDRYGEIEIEGVLLTGERAVDFASAGPCYGWMPLDLGELPEAERLRCRLAAMQPDGV